MSDVFEHKGDMLYVVGMGVFLNIVIILSSDILNQRFYNVTQFVTDRQFY